MAQKHKVHQDMHGLFIRAGGYLFRPVLPSYYPIPPRTQLRPGDKVSATHLGGTELCRVKGSSGVETWFSHGSYINVRNTATLWKPDYHQWRL